MLIKILIVLAVVIVVFLIVAALQSSDLKVGRSVTISAPAASVFAEVNDLHRWKAWSPWEKLDPALQRNYEGPATGVGAVYSWEGNNQVGSGRMTIIESRPSDLIRLKLDFLKPFAATNASDFEFKSEGGQTLVTWTMTGRKLFVIKAIGLFMNMDKMVGDQFAEGLANLKTLTEGGAKK